MSADKEACESRVKSKSLPIDRRDDTCARCGTLHALDECPTTILDETEGCGNHTIGSGVDREGCCVSCGEDLNDIAIALMRRICGDCSFDPCTWKGDITECPVVRRVMQSAAADEMERASD